MIAPNPRDTPAKRSARLRSRTWAEIKDMIEAAGVVDSDPTYSIDVGPYAAGVVIRRTDEGVEVEDDSAPVMDR